MREARPWGDGDFAVRVSDLTVSYNGVTVLDRITFECAAGSWTLLVGASGSGKSTILRAINGLVSPSGGRVYTLGSAIPGRTRREAMAVWKRTGTALQEIALFETKSARGNVEVGLRAAGVHGTMARRQATEWLERFNLGHKVDAYPWALSGGERQRVALARALAPCPSLLLVDEPLAALDRGSGRLVLDAIHELTATGTTVVMTSHRVDEVVTYCDRHLQVANRRLHEVEPADASQGHR